MAIGKKLDLEVIAEGVETLEQDAFIRHEECDLGQGYLYGKPITAIQFEQAFIHKKEH
nr:EAL domain-containing protein [Shewanella sp. SM65]